MRTGKNHREVGHEITELHTGELSGMDHKTAIITLFKEIESKLKMCSRNRKLEELAEKVYKIKLVEMKTT